MTEHEPGTPEPRARTRVLLGLLAVVLAGVLFLLASLGPEPARVSGHGADAARSEAAAGDAGGALRAPADEHSAARVERDTAGGVVVRGPEQREAQAEHSPVIVGRFTGTDGAPLATEFVDYRLRYRARMGGLRSSDPRELLTHADGSFSFEWTPEPAGRSPTEIRFRRASGPLAATTEVTVAWPPIVAGCGDCGVVQLGGDELLGSGSVVDDEGRPIPEAWLVPAFLEVHVDEYGEPRGTWLDVENGGSETNSQGRFACRGTRAGEGLRFRVGAEGHSQLVTAELTPGAADLRFVLRRLAAVSGSVLLPEGGSSVGLTVSLAYPPAPEAGGGYVNYDQTTRVDSGGEFRLRTAAVGVCELRVGILPEERTLLTVPGLVVQPPGVAQDPRLEGIDLTHVLSVLHLTLVDPDGSPVPSGEVRLGQPSRRWPQRAFSFRSGELSLTTAELPLRWVDVHAPGFRDAHLESVAEDRRITLRRGIVVTLRLPSTFPLPREGVRLDAVLVRDDGRGSSALTLMQCYSAMAHGTRASVQATFTEERELKLVVPSHGTWLPGLLLRDAQRGGNRLSRLVRLRGRTRLELQEVDEALECSLAPSLLDYRKKVQEMIGGG